MAPTEAAASPRLTSPRESDLAMGVAAEPICVVEFLGVNASGEGDRAELCVSLATPFVLGPDAWGSPSGGRKTTLIFFSWMEPLAVCSIWAHYVELADR